MPLCSVIHIGDTCQLRYSPYQCCHYGYRNDETLAGNCTICGPLGSFLLFISIRYFPRLALCGLIHGLYNLMPIYPLDGGRIVKCLLHIILPDPEREMRIQIILTTINLLFSIYILIILLRYSLWFLFVIPIFSSLREAIIKIPCKHGLKRVQ